MPELLHHFPDDLLRAYAVGSASEGARLAVSCHFAFCLECQAAAAAHESVLVSLVKTISEADGGPGRAFRDRLVDSLPAQPPAPAARPAAALPDDLSAADLPPPLLNHLGALPKVSWRRLLPGIRAIDLGISGSWRARLVSFRPGIPIPLHDHGGPEHTVVFTGGLEDERGHLGRGDAATMLVGETHSQRIAPGQPCLALIVNDGPLRPLTLMGRILKRVTGS